MPPEDKDSRLSRLPYITAGGFDTAASAAADAAERKLYQLYGPKQPDAARQKLYQRFDDALQAHGSKPSDAALAAKYSHPSEGYSPGPFQPKKFDGGAGAGAPAGLAALAGQGQGQGQPVNPLLAAVQKDPSLLRKTVPMGSSTTSVYQRGIKSLPLYQKGLERTARAQAQAVAARAGAEATAQQEKAFAANLRGAEMDFFEGQRERQQAEYDKGVEDFNAKMTAKREEISAAKDLDAGRWWSSRSVGQKIALGLAAGLQGFIQGYRNQQGPNPVIAMMERAVNRDLKVQQANYARKRGEFKDIQGAYAIFRQQGMDDQQALAQTKIGILERYQGRLEQIGADAQSAVIRANAQAAAAGIEQNLLQAKNAAYQAAQPKVRSSTSTRRVPVIQLLKDQMKQQGGPTKPPTNETKTAAGNINSARKALIHYVHAYKKLKAKPGTTAWAGGEGDAVVQMRKMTVEKLAVALKVDKAAMLEMLKGQLGTKWSSDKDVATRVTNLGRALDALEEEKLAAEAPYHNIKPLALRGINQRRLFWSAIGGKGH